MNRTPETPASDADLLRRARAGDDEALDGLLRRIQGKVYSFGLRMCNDPEDAKDVLQETLLSLARSLRDFRGQSSLSTWLYAIARSICIKSRRKSKFAPNQTLDIDDPSQRELAASGPTPDRALEDAHAQVAVERALRALEPAQREVLVLRDLEGLTTPQVADVLSLSEAAVKSRLHRARAALREQLAGTLGGSPSADAGSDCPDIVALFSHYLEGDITPDVCARMQSHVDDCMRCSAACDSLKHTLNLCSRAPRAQVPPEVEQRIREQMRAVLANAPGA